MTKDGFTLILIVEVLRGDIELCEDEHHQIRKCTVCGASKNVDENDYTYEVGIFKIEMPIFIPNAPCGDLIVTHEGNVYTVQYQLHIDAEEPTKGVVCTYHHNGMYSDPLPLVSKDEETKTWTWSFTAYGPMSYKIEVQASNDGGTITMEETVN